MRPVFDNVGNVTSFGQDGRAELYVTVGDGRVLKLLGGEPRAAREGVARARVSVGTHRACPPALFR